MEPPADLTPEVLRVQGLERTYWTARPPSGVSGAPPLLVVLHGAGAQGQGTAALTKLHTRGPAAGFFTVFPDGVRRVWNDSRHGGPALRRRAGVDDVGFLQALVSRLVSDGRVRGDAVYLCGISNGALMSEHVARHALLPVNGIGLVAGPGTARSRAAMPSPAQPATVVLFSGTADPMIPYAGGPIGPLGRIVQRHGGGAGTDRGLAVGAEAAAAEWAAANGITTEPTVDEIPMPTGDLAVTRLVWRADGCRSVTLFRVEGGGHTWPGGAQYLPERFVGRVARALDSTGLLLDAFRVTS
jgi:polyhydroxybutyrate depolymerase